jgi:hypothetical protein
MREKVADRPDEGKNIRFYSTFPPYPNPLPHGEGTKNKVKNQYNL